MKLTCLKMTTRSFILRSHRHLSLKENLLVVAGNPETKGLSEVTVDKENQKNDALEEDVPELVGTFEDA